VSADRPVASTIVEAEPEHQLRCQILVEELRRLQKPMTEVLV
jgi:hypothetical protein